MAEIYDLSKNENSDLILSLGRGTVMFSHVGALAGQVADWLTANLKSVGSVQEISFKAEDGVVMRGRLRLPDLKDGSKAPAVVFVHGANHDQGTYYDLARAATKKGLATLTFDRRGKNEDPELANHNAERLAPEQRGAAYRDNGDLDVKAAIQFMASQKQVDSNRIALVAATAGVAEAVKAAVGDLRIKTLVMLTVSSLPSPDGVKYLSTADVPIFTAASSEDVNDRGNLAEVTRQTYELSASKRSQFLLYDNAGRGTEMLKYKPELQTMIVRWLAEKLGATSFMESKKAAKTIDAK